MNRSLTHLSLLSLVVMTGGCSAFAPPRPLAANEAYWCCPGSALPRRVALDTHGDLPGLRVGAHRSTRCGAF